MKLINPAVDLVLNVTLARSTVLLGEPILLNYEVATNNGDFRLYLGRDHDKWITLELVDKAGQSAPMWLDPRKPQGGMYSDSGSATPERPYHGTLVVTRTLHVSHAGRYELHAKARLPYLPLPLIFQEQPGGLLPKPWHETVETVLVQEQSFVITVLEPEEVRLREIAEKLRQEAVQLADFDERIAAVRALLSMPEQYALASWKALAEDPLFRHRNILMNELARVLSPNAADVLALIWEPVPGPWVISNPSTVLLDNMYRAGDVALKQHIEEIFARHGKAISEHPLTFPGA